MDPRRTRVPIAPDAAPAKAQANDRDMGGRFTATVVPDPDPPVAGLIPGDAPILGSRRVVSDSGVANLTSARGVGLHFVRLPGTRLGWRRS